MDSVFEIYCTTIFCDLIVHELIEVERNILYSPCKNLLLHPTGDFGSFEDVSSDLDGSAVPSSARDAFINRHHRTRVLARVWHRHI